MSEVQGSFIRHILNYTIKQPGITGYVCAVFNQWFSETKPSLLFPQKQINTNQIQNNCNYVLQFKYF